MMRLAKPIFAAVLAISLSAYAIDCGTMEDAPASDAVCCRSMPCSSHGHQGQNCCKTMQPMHAPFVQSASACSISFAPALLSVTVASGQHESLDSSARIVAAHCHAPPIFHLQPPQPLRI